jgi:hypothetical protein
MPVKLGNKSISAMYLGNTAIARAYLGNNLVFETTPPSLLDPDAAAYIAAVETADTQTLEPAIQTAINDFVVGCKTDGIWDAIKASCIMAGARTLAGALVPLKGTAPTNFNFVSADYDRKTGLKGDGSTKYLDSNRANDADPQNSNHNAVFISTNSGLLMAFMGAGNVGTGANNLFRGGGAGAPIYRNRSSNFFTATSTPLRLMGSSRSASSSYIARNRTGSVTVTEPSQVPSSQNVLVFARSQAASNDPENISDARLSFYSIGESLDLVALDARVSDLMTAIDGALP